MLILSAAVAFVCWGGVHHIEFLRAGEHWLSDFRVAMFSPAEPQNSEIVVLGIDEATLSRFPYRSPVQRDFLARVLNTLAGAGMRAVGIDMLFDQRTIPADDAALREALLSLQVPVIVGKADARAGLSEKQLEFQQDYLQGISTGLVNLLKDSDGVVRHIYPGHEQDGIWHDSFPLALARALGVSVPSTSVKLVYRGGGKGEPAFRRYPAHVVASGILPPQWVADRVVLIGADLPQEDRHRTPLRLRPGSEPTMPGVLIHAHALAQLMEGMRFPDVTPWVAATWLAGFVLLGALLAWVDWSLWIKISLVIAVLANLGVAGCLLFQAGGPMIPLFLPGLGFAASFTVLSVYVGRRIKASERYIRRAFGQYLSPDVISRLVADPEKLALGGEKRKMSFLFSDIAGFTTLSESLSPERLVALLQDYLDNMVDIALRHHGTIDKFIGDAVVVIFGAPSDQPDHAERAVRCAIEMDIFAQEFRLARERDGIQFGVTRIGVHTGVATVGNLGGQRRFDYTAIGDTVNTAARLESVNKHLGTRVCISAVAASDCNGLGLRPVGTLVLKGKEEGLDVYSLFDSTSDSHGTEYGAAFEAMKAGSPRAAELFGALREKYPTDPLIAFHSTRLSQGETGSRIVMKEK